MKIAKVDLKDKISFEIGETSFFILKPLKDVQRSEITIKMPVERTSAQFILAEFIKKDRIKLSINIEHLASRTESSVIVRTVLSRGGKFDFFGNIKVPAQSKNVKGTMDAKGLAEEDEVVWKARPHLEIENMEVDVRHSTTLTDFDEEQMLYLNSKGIPEKESELLLKESFLREVLSTIVWEDARNYYKDYLADKMRLA